jgi:mRNA-degrading endonuclease RelE of RelBE toxin-antitoxin system
MALLIPPKAAKQLAALPRRDAERLLNRLEDISSEPHIQHPGVTAMASQERAFRVRQGNWRAVFVIEDDDIIVDRVGHRRDIYCDQLEDLEDLAAIAARREYEATMGKNAARRHYLTADEVRQLLRGESPVKIWRAKRGLSQRDLAKRAAVSPSYLAEIETCRKPGSAAALLRLSRVLETSLEDLLPAK